MGSTSDYMHEITSLLAGIQASGDRRTLIAFLRTHSNLPGPRGNLELAQAFARAAEQAAAGAPEYLWQLCMELAATGSDQAPVNDPGEFVVFCGVRGVGAVAAAIPQRYSEAMSHLRVAARDARWRVREAVAMALQDLIASRGEEVLVDLEGWVQARDWLAMRAVAAGVAEPRLLKDAGVARGALALHRLILEQLATHDPERSDAFRSLRQGLGYSLSVVVNALPAEGWAYLRELATTGNEEIKWIVRENLKKARLLKNYPVEAQDVAACLQA